MNYIYIDVLSFDIIDYIHISVYMKNENHNQLSTLHRCMKNGLDVIFTFLTQPHYWE